MLPKLATPTPTPTLTHLRGRSYRSLESKIKSLNIKIDRNKKRRKRMETCAPTDLSYPVQNVLCRFSGYACAARPSLSSRPERATTANHTLTDSNPNPNPL